MHGFIFELFDLGLIQMTEKMPIPFHLLDAHWDNELVPLLSEYIKIPNKSPHFDKNWQGHGFMAQAMTLIHDWVKKQPVKGMKHEVITLDNRTPLLFIEIDGQC